MGISIWKILIVLAIVLLLFGIKRLRNVGGDLGNAIKGLKNAMSSCELKQVVQEYLEKNQNSGAASTSVSD